MGSARAAAGSTDLDVCAARRTSAALLGPLGAGACAAVALRLLLTVCTCRGALYASPLGAALPPPSAGETPWVREIIDKHHEEARKKNLRIVPCCGEASLAAAGLSGCESPGRQLLWVEDRAGPPVAAGNAPCCLSSTHAPELPTLPGRL